jgi:hypothetical protein
MVVSAAPTPPLLWESFSPAGTPVPFDATIFIQGSGSYDPVLANAATEVIYPFMDGSDETTRLPCDIDLQNVPLNPDIPGHLTVEQFLSLHPAHQMELAHRFQGYFRVREGEGLDVLLSSDGRSVLILQQISRQGFAALSEADQKKIAHYLATTTVPDAALAKLAETWKVTITVGGSVEANRAAAQKIVDDVIKEIQAKGSEHDKDYIEELKILKKRIDTQSLFSHTEIQGEVAKVKERFDRMNAFEKLEGQTLVADSDGLTPSLSSLDNNKTILSGLNALLDQQKRMLNVKTVSLSLVTDPGTLDMPNLIAALQLVNNIYKEAEVAVLTEELNQHNALLKDYAAMQKIVNDVLKAFPANGDEAEKRNFFGFRNPQDMPNSNLTEEQKRAVSMFETFKNGVDSLPHPIEGLRGISRPRQDNVRDGHTVEYTRSSWSIYSTQLSDAVNLLNQGSQVLTNDISSLNEERNRHVEMSSSVLRKMADMISTISHT